MPNENEDVKVESSTTTDVNQTSSTEQQQEAKPTTVEDIVAQLKEKHKIDAPSESQSEKKAEEKSEVPNENQTQKQEEKKETPPAKKDEELPFGKHPRFQELLRQNQEATKLVEQYKPIVERAQQVEQYLVQNNIPPEDYTQTLELLALVRSNPTEAVKRLEQVTQSLKMSVGELLPPDLAKEVEEGLITADAAKREAKYRVELAQLKAQGTRNEQTAQQRQQAELVNSLNAWTTSKLTSDPAFKPKANANEPDGKFEIVFAKYMQLWQGANVRTAQDAVALAERAYGEVDQFVSRMLPPKPKISRPLNSTKSQNGQQKQTIDVSKPGWARRVRETVLG